MAKSAKLTGEERLIARYFKPLARHPAAFGLDDDAAVLSPPPGTDVVLKTDAIVGGMHFFHEDSAEHVARKALRVNLSDLAAKGAKPAGFLVSLALPSNIGAKWLAGFSRGLKIDAQAYGCPLLGGDTDRTSGPVTVAIAAFGLLPADTMVLRSGAKVGDRVVVSGTIGDAVLGLRLRRKPGLTKRWGLSRSMQKHLLGRYLLPQPRSVLAEAVRTYASAAMDVSDGLAGDLGKLCRASNVGAEIDAGRVPLSAAARKALAGDRRLLEAMLSGGDDYEILATVAPARLALLLAAARKTGVRLTDIGEIVKGEGERFRNAKRKLLKFKQASFSHF